jgi:hypothetical protein
MLREKLLHHKPARHRLDSRNSAAPAKGTPRKWPENCLKITENESASVGRVNRETMLRYLLAFLALLERAAGPPRPTAALPQISPMEPVKTPFPRAQRCSLGPSSPP